MLTERLNEYREIQEEHTVYTHFWQIFDHLRDVVGNYIPLCILPRLFESATQIFAHSSCANFTDYYHSFVRNKLEKRFFSKSNHSIHILEEKILRNIFLPEKL